MIDHLTIPHTMAFFFLLLVAGVGFEYPVDPGGRSLKYQINWDESISPERIVVKKRRKMLYQQVLG